MNDKGRGRLLSSAGIGVAALVPAAGLALLAAQVGSTGYVLPAAVNTLAGPTSQTPSLPTSSPPEPATVDDEPIAVDEPRCWLRLEGASLRHVPSLPHVARRPQGPVRSASG